VEPQSPLAWQRGSPLEQKTRERNQKSLGAELSREPIGRSIPEEMLPTNQWGRWVTISPTSLHVKRSEIGKQPKSKWEEVLEKIELFARKAQEWAGEQLACNEKKM